MKHWLVKYTRLGMGPPWPFGKTSTVVCAESSDAAKCRVNASPHYRVTASVTDAPVQWPNTCHCRAEAPCPEK